MPADSPELMADKPSPATGEGRRGRVCVTRLNVRNYRNLEHAALEPAEGFNLILGENGAGKTSLLEAIYLLGRGRSFRPARVQQLVREGMEAFEVSAAVRDGRGEHRIGVRRSVSDSTARLDGRPAGTVGELARVLPVVVFEPHSHELVEGGPEGRRRFLDWGVFHVEPAFLDSWRRYRKALRQRNAALRKGAWQQAGSWVPELGASGEALTAMRERYVSRLAPVVSEVATELAPELGALRLDYRPGWPGEAGLSKALEDHGERDAAAGHTSLGPHRGDLRLAVNGRSAARRLSRGQEKLAALALCLGQAQLFRNDAGGRAVMLLDDLPSELDRGHLERAASAVADLDAQCFLTAVEPPEVFRELARQGQAVRLENGSLTAPAGD